MFTISPCRLVRMARLVLGSSRSQLARCRLADAQSMDKWLSMREDGSKDRSEDTSKDNSEDCSKAGR